MARDFQLRYRDLCDHSYPCNERNEIVHPETCTDQVLMDCHSERTLSQWITSIDGVDVPMESSLIEWLRIHWPHTGGGSAPISYSATYGITQSGNTFMLNIDPTGGLEVVNGQLRVKDNIKGSATNVGVNTSFVNGLNIGNIIVNGTSLNPFMIPIMTETQLGVACLGNSSVLGSFTSNASLSAGSNDVILPIQKTSANKLGVRIPYSITNILEKFSTNSGSQEYNAYDTSIVVNNNDHSIRVNPLNETIWSGLGINDPSYTDHPYIVSNDAQGLYVKPMTATEIGGAMLGDNVQVTGNITGYTESNDTVNIPVRVKVVYDNYSSAIGHKLVVTIPNPKEYDEMTFSTLGLGRIGASPDSDYPAIDRDNYNLYRDPNQVIISQKDLCALRGYRNHSGTDILLPVIHGKAQFSDNDNHLCVELPYFITKELAMPFTLDANSGLRFRPGTEEGSVTRVLEVTNQGGGDTAVLYSPGNGIAINDTTISVKLANTGNAAYPQYGGSGLYMTSNGEISCKPSSWNSLGSGIAKDVDTEDENYGVYVSGNNKKLILISNTGNKYFLYDDYEVTEYAKIESTGETINAPSNEQLEDLEDEDWVDDPSNLGNLSSCWMITRVRRFNLQSDEPHAATQEELDNKANYIAKYYYTYIPNSVIQ